jgi:hypothetical protein
MEIIFLIGSFIVGYITCYIMMTAGVDQDKR